MIKTSIRLLRIKLNDVHQDHTLGIIDGFMDIVFLVIHLGIRPLIVGQAYGMEENKHLVPRDGISITTLNT